MTLRSFLSPSLIAIGAIALAASAQAAPLKVDAAKSAVTATFKQLNVPIDAKFKKFTAAIDFDPAKPAEGRASVDIDIASFDLGAAEYNQEVQKKEWFNAAQFPKATFVASSIKPSAGAPAGTRFDVAGKLTIKGKSTDVSFPLAVKKEGNAQVFDGTLPIKRLTYNIGEGEWKDTGMVADEVSIKFHIVATP
ncbi:YceI family protein [Herbaspirillum sp. SJZ099]|uniref:YceI family protein n=1 Tax=Herbaspirillum sp. SJZ099 TaxID=2572916 RepID=UPI0011A76AFE|nr:YceI family protein [Herbaspirillum sp. SJZ099]TWC68215.1 polyisoprenoid-binding protein YceI [Herbaspirillum sp. SJZ099]